ncbi:MAG TPA: VanW family protein [Candidatus Binatia bacterium]|nr:VanW family protein [Candidatus Binatia bacterium]
MTTITLPRRFMRPVATPPARRSMIVGFIATLAAGLVLLAGVSAAVGISAGSAALPGVSVGGVSIAGLDRASAAERLADRLPSLSAGEAVISVGDSEEVVAFADLGRGYEMEAMLDAAFGVGRGAGPIGDGVERLRTLAHATSLPVIVHAYDADALASISIEIAERVTHHPVEAAVLRDGTSFTVRPSEPGEVLEASAVHAALAAAVDSTDPSDVQLRLTSLSVPPIVDTAAAELAATAAEGIVADLELTIAGAAEEEEAFVIDAETIASWITFGPQGTMDYTARVDTAAVTSTVQALAPDVDRDPVSARIGIAAGGGLGGVIPGQDGRELNVEVSVAGLLDGLAGRAGGSRFATMGLTLNVIEPSFTTAQAAAARPQMRMISTWTTYFVPGESNGYGNNIVIGARDLDGRNLEPGEWFSFWGGIGPVTFERGYQYGGVIIGGRSVPTGAIGGGICSTSTTIFNAALRAGLEMGARANHSYYIDRYPIGLDATVLISGSSVQDMTFRNDTEHPIVIRGFGGAGSVTFQLWSVPTGRTVTITDPATSNHRAAIDTTQVDPNMAPGTAKRVEFPHNGFNVTRTRYVYDANGNEIHRNTYFSAYRTVNGVTLVGPPAPAPAAPEPPAEETATAGTEPAAAP